MNDLINDAADLMAQTDDKAADVFRTQPFSRPTIARAFRKGFAIQSPHTQRVCDLLDQIVNLDIKARSMACP